MHCCCASLALTERKKSEITFKFILSWNFFATWRKEDLHVPSIYRKYHGFRYSPYTSMRPVSKKRVSIKDNAIFAALKPKKLEKGLREAWRETRTLFKTLEIQRRN